MACEEERTAARRQAQNIAGAFEAIADKGGAASHQHEAFCTHVHAERKARFIIAVLLAVVQD